MKNKPEKSENDESIYCRKEEQTSWEKGIRRSFPAHIVEKMEKNGTLRRIREVGE